MAVRYHTRIYHDNVRIPHAVEVIWGEEGPDGRPVIASGRFAGKKGLWARMTGKAIDERDKVASGFYKLIRYTRTSSPRLTLKNYIVILKGFAGPARLKDGLIVDDDPDLYAEGG